MNVDSAVTESVVRNHLQAFLEQKPIAALTSDYVAYLTWHVGDDIPLGTDTFVVRDGKIISQTFAMYAVSP